MLDMDESERQSFAVVSAPTNIALVKYWGKRCEKLNLPLNSSISATLNQDHLKTTTTVRTSPLFVEDELWLNDKKQDVSGNPRLVNCLSEIRRVARKQAINRGQGSAKDMTFFSQKVQVHSRNNFPTAAGLASSASGYAALVYALGELYGIDGDLTMVARQGSGSACRSLHGGFVEWKMGEEQNGEDSVAVQIVPETHWEELRIFVLVVNDTMKKVGSTAGMQSTVRTSKLIEYRAREIVDERMASALVAIRQKNFSDLATTIMKESNQLHAVCLDTFPPLRYLNDTSFLVMELIHAYNDACGSVRAAYTFDAGPNACIFTTEIFASEIAWLIMNFFPSHDDGGSSFLRGLETEPKPPSEDVLCELKFGINRPGLLKYAICTCLGPGPQLIEKGAMTDEVIE